MCGTGGGSLGSNGIFYAEWNKEPSGGTTGHLSAFNATNGEKIWQRDTWLGGFCKGLYGLTVVFFELVWICWLMFD